MSRCIASEEEALSCRLEEGWRTSSHLIHLTPPGTRWPFHFVETPQECPKVIKGVGFEGTSKWKDCAVPATWETEGFGQALCECPSVEPTHSTSDSCSCGAA